MSPNLIRIFVLVSSAVMTAAVWFVLVHLIGTSDVVGAMAGLALGTAEGLFLNRIFSRVHPG